MVDSAEPGSINLEVFRGATFTHCFTYETEDGNAIPINDRKARMMIREEIDDPDPAILIVVSDGSPPVWQRLVVGPDAGENLLSNQLKVILGATITEQLVFDHLVYDIELELLTDAEDVLRFAEGDIVSRNQVTR